MLILKQVSWKMQDTGEKTKEDILELPEVNVCRKADVKKGNKTQKKKQRYKYISWH